MKKIPQQPLILFDGVCNLCNSSVQKIIKIDKHHKFKFASLQSDAGKEILLQFSTDNSKMDSVLLLQNNQIYAKSSAILGVFKEIGGFYKLLLIFWLVPKPIRNWMYDFIAKNRYNWFGKQKEGMIPTPELKEKFLL